MVEWTNLFPVTHIELEAMQREEMDFGIRIISSRCILDYLWRACLLLWPGIITCSPVPFLNFSLQLTLTCISVFLSRDFIPILIRPNWTLRSQDSCTPILPVLYLLFRFNAFPFYCKSIESLRARAETPWFPLMSLAQGTISITHLL